MAKIIKYLSEAQQAHKNERRNPQATNLEEQAVSDDEKQEERIPSANGHPDFIPPYELHPVLVTSAMLPGILQATHALATVSHLRKEIDAAYVVIDSQKPEIDKLKLKTEASDEQTATIASLRDAIHGMESRANDTASDMSMLDKQLLQYKGMKKRLFDFRKELATSRKQTQDAEVVGELWKDQDTATEATLEGFRNGWYEDRKEILQRQDSLKAQVEQLRRLRRDTCNCPAEAKDAVLEVEKDAEVVDK